MFQLNQSGREKEGMRERILLSFIFCSIQALSKLDDAQHWGGQSALLSLLIQTLVSSGLATSQTHPERMFNQGTGHPLTQST